LRGLQFSDASGKHGRSGGLPLQFVDVTFLTLGTR
jgi:hypothetical protein